MSGQDVLLSGSLPKLTTEKIVDIVIAQTFKEYKTILKNERIRPMLTDALYKMGYYKHLSNKLVISDKTMIFEGIPQETEVDNSVFAKDLMKIMDHIIFILTNEEDNQISQKYKHVKSKQDD